MSVSVVVVVVVAAVGSIVVPAVGSVAVVVVLVVVLVLVLVLVGPSSDVPGVSVIVVLSVSLQAGAAVTEDTARIAGTHSLRPMSGRTAATYHAGPRADRGFCGPHPPGAARSLELICPEPTGRPEPRSIHTGMSFEKCP